MLLIDLFFPRRCPMCDGVLPLGELICAECAKELRRVMPPYCLKCGKPIADAGKEFCPDCQSNVHLYREGRALYEYRAVRASIYRFKYRGRYEYAAFYGKALAEGMEAVIRRWQPDALVPVPLHKARKRKRGYNQAEALARVLGKTLDIPVDTTLIQRVKKTTPQKQLNRQMRQNNLKKAFKIDRNDVKLNTIIIIDDIYTTGSTIDAMASALLEAGIQNIYFIALAIGRG